MKRLLILSLAALVWFSGCTSPTDSNDDNQEPVSSTVFTVEARPSRVPADGHSKMVIFTEYRENNQPVPDSTRIILLNTIGTLGLGELYTQDGIAIDTLTADSTVALGVVIAVAPGVRDSIEIAFEPVDPE